MSQFERARAQYKETEIPEELNFLVASAIRKGERQQSHKKALRRSLTTALAGCACFVVLLNASPTFAQAVAEVPVLGDLARIVTIREYQVEDDTKQLDVRLPALKDTGNAALEERVNTEIQTRVDTVMSEAQERAAMNKEAFVQTGGEEADFIPVDIKVDYEIKSQTDRYLSFVLTKTETQANAYTEYIIYNVDLETGKDLTLPDLLGADYMEKANEAVRAGIDEKSKIEGNFFFDGSEGVEGFQSISENQKFYINEAGNPVILFEKYEIAPGYMGSQEFEVQR